MQSEMIERAQVVGYLRFLARHTMTDTPPDFLARHPELGAGATRLLASGLSSAARQVEDGTIDMADFKDEPDFV